MYNFAFNDICKNILTEMMSKEEFQKGYEEYNKRAELVRLAREKYNAEHIATEPYPVDARIAYLRPAFGRLDRILNLMWNDIPTFVVGGTVDKYHNAAAVQEYIDNKMGVDTACATLDREIYISKPFMDGLENKELLGIIAHEILHIKMLDLIPQTFNGKIHLLWNLATDIINNDIVINDMKLAMPYGSMCPQKDGTLFLSGFPDPIFIPNLKTDYNKRGLYLYLKRIYEKLPQKQKDAIEKEYEKNKPDDHTKGGEKGEQGSGQDEKENGGDPGQDQENGNKNGGGSGDDKGQLKVGDWIDDTERGISGHITSIDGDNITYDPDVVKN